MKPPLSPDLEILKSAFCSGESDALDSIFSICFPELFIMVSKGSLDEQAMELYILKEIIKNEPTSFCESKDSVTLYLRKKWRSQLGQYRSGEISFDEAYMSPEEESGGREHSADKTELPLAYQYFLAALSPLNRLLFEVKYAQELENRNGYFYIFQFLLNTSSIGNDEITKTLQKEAILVEPMISTFLLDKAMSLFIAKHQVKIPGDLTSILKLLPRKNKTEKADFIRICHRTEVHLNRVFKNFKKEWKWFTDFSPLETALYFLNKYSDTEHHIEIWVRLNLDAINNSELRTDMNKMKLLDKHNLILKKHGSLRRKIILKRLSINKGEEQKIIQIIEDLQNEIDKKIKKTVIWKTN
ncbi:MAG: hypothetical protein ACI9RM_002255 [Ulvibacter sp.]|jgi:hypothetical protein